MAKKETAVRPQVGARILEGLEQAVAWTQGQTTGAQVTVVQASRDGDPVRASSGTKDGGPGFYRTKRGKSGVVGL